MVLSLNNEQKQNCFRNLDKLLEPLMPEAETFYLDLGGLKTVRVIACDADASPMIRHQLAWSLTAPVESPDATLILWRETVDKKFHQRILNIEAEDV